MKIVAGVDIGSLTAKTVIMAEGRGVVSSRVVYSGIVSEETAVTSLQQALDAAGVALESLDCIVTTGYGRNLVTFGTRSVTEISCHARGATWVMPDVRTVIDIGGQDSKVIRIDDRGNVANFVMNDKCAAGTGRFLEVMAGALKVKLEEMGEVALQSKNPAEISSMCTVFAESEVVSRKAHGCSTVDILGGVHLSIARRVAAMVKRVGVRPVVMMSGGVAKNKAMVHNLKELLETDIVVSSEPQIMGALGAALVGMDSATDRAD